MAAPGLLRGAFGATLDRSSQTKLVSPHTRLNRAFVGWRVGSPRHMAFDHMPARPVRH